MILWIGFFWATLYIIECVTLWLTLIMQNTYLERLNRYDVIMHSHWVFYTQKSHTFDKLLHEYSCIEGP